MTSRIRFISRAAGGTPKSTISKNGYEGLIIISFHIQRGLIVYEKGFFFFFLFPWKCASARLLGNNGVVDGSPLLCAPLPVFILAVFLKVLKPGAYPKHSFESLNLSLFFGPLPSFSLSRRSSPLLIRRELFFFLPLRRRKTNKKKKTLFSI